MLIFLVRHAPAVDPTGRRDEDRPLTGEGRIRMRRVVEFFASNIQERFSQIITSPYVRATQTAEILAALPGFAGQVEVSRLLIPSARPKETLPLLYGLDHNIALVGHEPAMSTFASELLDRIVPSFKKGAIWLLERSNSRETARFVWALNPKQHTLVTRLEDLD
jgi:phosphohistidine phosphatase